MSVYGRNGTADPVQASRSASKADARRRSPRRRYRAASSRPYVWIFGGFIALAVGQFWVCPVGLTITRAVQSSARMPSARCSTYTGWVHATGVCDRRSRRHRAVRHGIKWEAGCSVLRRRILLERSLSSSYIARPSADCAGYRRGQLGLPNGQSVLHCLPGYRIPGTRLKKSRRRS